MKRESTLTCGQKLQTLTFTAIKCILSVFGNAQATITEGQANDLAALVDIELSTIPNPATISEITVLALEVFESDAPHSTTALSVLPRALVVLSSQMHHPSVHCFSSDPCQAIVTRILKHIWKHDSIPQILSILREFCLTEDMIRLIILHACTLSRRADAQDVPVITHQLLSLAAKSSVRSLNVRGHVVGLIVDLVEQKIAASSVAHETGALHQLAGSVLLHIEMAAKHDEALGSSWIKQLKLALSSLGGPIIMDSTGPSQYALAVSFTLAGMLRYESAILEALKTAVILSYKDSLALKQKAPYVLAATIGGTTTPTDEPHTMPSLPHNLLRCADMSRYGHIGVVQPLVSLASSLLESTLTEGVSELGVRLLIVIFKVHKTFRKDIVSLACSRLIGAKEELALPWVALLARLIREEGIASSSDIVPEVKTSLEGIVYLPSGIALGLLLAAWPLSRCRRDAKDFLVMLLRKSMFNRELHMRLLAARGLLLLMNEEMDGNGIDDCGGGDDTGEGPSQVSMSQRNTLGSEERGATLLHELVGFLRRSLSQQQEVRKAVYLGLPALLDRDPAAAEPVLEPLLPHFAQYYETNSALDPCLKLDVCIKQTTPGDAPKCIEPLQYQLQCILHLLRMTGKHEKGGTAASALRDWTQALKRRMSASTLESFRLDRSIDWGSRINHMYADVLLGCIEALMEDIVWDLAKEEDGVDPEKGNKVEALATDLLALYCQHKRLVDLVNDCAPLKRTGAKRSVKTSQSIVDTRIPVFSPLCLGRLMDALVDDGLVKSNTTGGHHMSAQVTLVRDVHFQTFLFTAAIRMLSEGEMLDSEVHSAIDAGSAGDTEAADVARKSLLGVAGRPSVLLAGPLLRSGEMIMLAYAGQTSRESEQLVHAAATALFQLVCKACKPGDLVTATKILTTGLQPTKAATLSAAGIEVIVDDDVMDEEQEALSNARYDLGVKFLPYMRRILYKLADGGCGKDVELMCRIFCTLSTLASLPFHYVRAMAGWLSDHIHQPPPALVGIGSTAKTLMVSALHLSLLSGDNKDLELAFNVASTTKVAYNAEGDDGGGTVPEITQMVGSHFGILNSKSLLHVAAAVMIHIDETLTGLEWAVAKLQRSFGATVDTAAGDTAALRHAGRRRSSWEEAAFSRISSLSHLILVLTETRYDAGALSDHLLKVTTRYYKVAAMASRCCLTVVKGVHQPPPSKSFQDMVHYINKHVTEAVYSCISALSSKCENAEPNNHIDDHQDHGDGEMGQKKKKRKVDAVVQRAKKESRLIPCLIFAIEDYEKHLIKLGKACKLNLMISAKRTVNRDFKLDMTFIQQAAVAAHCHTEAAAVKEEAHPFNPLE